jgi:hypothetical protein
MGWLDALAPPPIQRVVKRKRERVIVHGSSLIEAVRAAWPTADDVFSHFGIGGRTRREPNGETRILGHGGLLVTEDGETWYNFSDEEGGGVLEAWAWCRYGSVEAKQQHFRELLLEMAQAAGIDTASYYRRGDETVRVPSDGDRGYWTRKTKRWGLMR